ncbi:hypothetical protein HX109_08640 [Galbibacter sp. BG1]|uniref:hypothetical protein n=1 Tax=Galbibacter sp. BG1 TaxID=1170699 RepID=UPI0015BE8C6C|nr:hypothetical protein [Galbibacter sp. BG1]QLE01631.1 hypothetical protein HX109_08640 [Galbibacter sp. BG1]
MKDPVKDILSLGYWIIMVVVLTFLMPPWAFKEASPKLSEGKIVEFKLEYLYNSKSYLGLSVVTNSSETLRIRFDTSKSDYKKVLRFLKKKDFIISKELNEVLPLHWYRNDERIKQMEKVAFKLKDTPKLDINGNIKILKRTKMEGKQKGFRIL